MYANFSFSTRIYYEDTDSGGMVYYANYLKFAERARTEWLRSLGFQQSELIRNEGIFIVVRRCEIDYRSPARLDDEIIVETCLHEISKVRMTMQQVIQRRGVHLAHLNVQLACVNAQGKPVRWPQVFVAAFESVVTS